MNTNPSLAPIVRRLLLLSAALSCSTPALADHMGASGFGSGGLTVFGPETLDEHHWAAGLRLSYTRPDRRSDEELEALAARHIHAHNTDYNLHASAGVAYGITHHLTVSAELPYVRRDGLREGEHSHVDGQSVNEVVQLGNVAGVGDVNILAKYRLTDGEGAGVALIGGIKVPTGNTTKRSSEGERLETEHQPGTGSWDSIFGAAVSKSFGAVQLAASALYQISTNGAQHTRLGNRLQGGIALSHRFGEARHEHAEGHNHHHGDELDEHQEHADSSWNAFVEIGGEWEGRQKVDGEIEDESGGSWAYVAPGLRFTSVSGWTAAAALALPFWQDIRESHPDNRYRVTVSLGRTF